MSWLDIGLIIALGFALLWGVAARVRIAAAQVYIDEAIKRIEAIESRVTRITRTRP